MSGDDRPYEVGYGKPPPHTRFRPGQSGNPRGRPKNARNSANIVRDALMTRVKLKENGRTRNMSKLEVSMTQLANKAAAGDLKAIAMVIGLYREVEAEASGRSQEAPLDRADREVLEMLLDKVRAASEADSDGR
ncbi:MAG: DUF5681 domain-containing protein [Pseudomonadota bacterium]|nr:DUF5681 domain-containing protein [Pseudomonadota bacterium]